MLYEIRKYLSWTFAFTALVCVGISYSLTPKMLGDHPPVGNLSLGWQIFLVTAPWIFPIFALVFSIAWWTSFKQKRSARIWGIIASLINLQVAIFPVLFPPHSIFNGFLLIFAIGVAGLVAFSQPTKKSDRPVEDRQTSAVPGDGTNDVLNQVAPFLALILGAAVFSWWLKWMRAKDVPWDHTNTYLTVASVLIILLMIAAHECGHAIVGLALGMRLRSFMVGPFQWNIRDGKWQFRFELRQIMVQNGATGIVPAVVNFPRWAYISMLLGGVFVNAVTGGVALWLALNRNPEVRLQTDGLLALFGALSLVMVVSNLVPFRSRIGYSDGAQIYQWLANGAWADLHRAFGTVGATLVTPLRPRDYDMQVLSRASRTIRQGQHALILRLFAYWHFLDLGKINEAGEALTEAAEVYNESASNVSSELLTVFVFGSAYVWRNAESTRAWSDRFQATKPTRFNTGYWLAASALHWVNGNLDDASKALAKADQLARELPSAGAYEFERYCCSLLRDALNKVPMPVG